MPDSPEIINLKKRRTHLRNSEYNFYTLMVCNGNMVRGPVAQFAWNNMPGHPDIAISAGSRYVRDRYPNGTPSEITNAINEKHSIKFIHPMTYPIIPLDIYCAQRIICWCKQEELPEWFKYMLTESGGFNPEYFPNGDCPEVRYCYVEDPVPGDIVYNPDDPNQEINKFVNVADQIVAIVKDIIDEENKKLNK